MAPREERWTEWTPEREMLTHIYDRLGTLIAATVGSRGGNAPQIPPYPRPKTAAHRVKAAQLRRIHDDLHSQLYATGEE